MANLQNAYQISNITTHEQNKEGMPSYNSWHSKKIKLTMKREDKRFI